MSKILVVDDEPDIRELLEYNLIKAGHECILAENGFVALEKIKTNKPDLILLDVMMPQMDGIQTCEAIRENNNNHDIVIAFLTARAEDYSQIAGLEAGSDDYIAKPIKPAVLISRIEALLRRKNRGTVALSKPSYERLIIDTEKHLVRLDEKFLQLPKKEFELLSLLVSKPNAVFQRDHILQVVWGTDVVVGDRTIDVHIRKIREKIGSRWIHTVKGVGYKFIPQ